LLRAPLERGGTRALGWEAGVGRVGRRGLAVRVPEKPGVLTGLGSSRGGGMGNGADVSAGRSG